MNILYKTIYYIKYRHNNIVQLNTRKSMKKRTKKMIKKKWRLKEK